jgi:hypothetical protein
MEARTYRHRPVLVLPDEDFDATVPPIWKDIAVSLTLALVLCLAFLL